MSSKELGTSSVKSAACLNCQKRYVGCHADCFEYKKFIEDHNISKQKEIEIKNEYFNYMGYVAEGSRKVIKSRNKR